MLPEGSKVTTRNNCVCIEEEPGDEATNLYALSKLACRLRALSTRSSFSVYYIREGSKLHTASRETRKTEHRTYFECSQLFVLPLCDSVQLSQRL